ncbi:DNA-directed RNA polymerase II core subunit rpo21, partial [Spiromyces aspiralis]
MSYLYQFAHSSAPVRRVDHVQFGILSPEELKSMSVAKIEHPELRDEDGRPKLGGLLDPRLGTIDRHLRCQTCGEDMAECPGHFGHIELARPVYHAGFLTRVKRVLECVCWYCSKLKADESDPEFVLAQAQKNPNLRSQMIWNLCKSRTVCGVSSAEAEENAMKKA